MPFYLNDRFVILSGEICDPRKGVWHARLEIEGAPLPLGSVATITMLNQRRKARIVQSGDFASHTFIELNGGLGSLDKSLPPKTYQQQPVRIPVGDILTDCNLTLGNSVPIMGSRLPNWSRMYGSASASIKRLINSQGGDYYYRIGLDGLVYLYDNAVNNAVKTLVEKRDLQVMSFDVLNQKYIIAPSLKLVSHDETWLDTEADDIMHVIDSSQLRTTVWLRK